MVMEDRRIEESTKRVYRSKLNVLKRYLASNDHQDQLTADGKVIVPLPSQIIRIILVICLRIRPWQSLIKDS